MNFRQSRLASKKGARIVYRPVYGIMARPEKSDVKNRSFVQRVDETISTTFSIVSKVLAMVIITVFLFLIVKEYRSNTFFLDKIHISPQIADQGYSERFVSSAIEGGIERISSEAKSRSDYREYVSTRSKPQLKVELAGTGWSFDEVLEFATSLFGHERKYIRIHLIKNDVGIISYLDIKGWPRVQMIKEHTSVDKAIQDALDSAAKQILLISDPTTLAYYYYRKRNFDNATKAATFVLTRNPRDSKWAYNLLGSIQNERKDYDSAIFFLQNAIKLDSSFVSAYNNLGIAYFNSTQPDGDSLAIRTFKKCLALDRQYKYASYMLGRVFSAHGEYDSAIYHYKQSIRIDSNYARAINNLAYTYSRLGLSVPQYYDSSLAILDKALSRPVRDKDEEALLWTTYGETKFYKSDTIGFFDCIKRSIVHGYRFKPEHLDLEPYKHFKNDQGFLKIIFNDKNSVPNESVN